MNKFTGFTQAIHTNNSGIRSVRQISVGRDYVTTTKNGHIFNPETGEGTSRWAQGSRIEPATPQLIAEVNAENAKHEAEFKAEQERIATDPKTPIISRLKAGDFVPWEKLTLEQLQQIATWLQL